MSRTPRRFWLVPLVSLPLVLLLAALTGCPGAMNSYPATSYTPSTGTSGASPTPTPPAEERTVSGTVYDEETGMHVPAAVVYLGGSFAGFTGLKGSFTATYSAVVSTPSLTVVKPGYANLTVHGYAGGPLAMPLPAASGSVASATRSITVTAPAGSATRALLSVAVKRQGYAYAKTEAFTIVTFSEAGTASADVALPEGEATTVAYGFDGDVAGSSQGPVGDALAVELKATPAFDGYQANVPEFKTGSGSALGYYLTWPSATPIAENRIELAVLTGEFLALGWGLPPVESFGIPGASYKAIADSSALSDSSLLARRELRSVTPGTRELTWLPQARWSKYRPGREETAVTFGIRPDAAVPEANAYVLDLIADKRVWRVVTQQAGTDLVEVPILKSGGLKVGTEYLAQLHAALNPSRYDSSETALTIGAKFYATYNAAADPTNTYRTFTVKPGEGGTLATPVEPGGRSASYAGSDQPLGRSAAASAIRTLLRSAR